MNAVQKLGQGIRTHVLPVIVFMFCVATVLHCAGNSVSGGDAPIIEVTPSPTIAFPQLTLGQTQAETVTISNNGKVPLTVDKVAISGGGGAFDQKGINQLPFVVDPGGSVQFQLTYQQIDESDKTADLIIQSNDPVRGSLVIKLLSSKPRPRLDVSPNPIEFVKRTDPGGTAQMEVLMKNVGTADLKISKIAKQGDQSFTLFFPVGSPFSDVADDGKPGANPEALVLKRNQIYKFVVVFKPTLVGEASGKVVIYTNDDTLKDNKKIIPIIANSKGPCLLVKPPTVDFGQTLLGSGDTRTVTLESCGKEPIQVKSIQLKSGSSADFQLEGIPATQLNQDLHQGDTIIFTVRYTPGENGPDDGLILIETNDENRAEMEVKVNGTGTDKLCPIAKIEVVEGLAVLPQTTLHLKGDGSTGADGATGSVVQWQWTVVQPGGSTSTFIPSSSVPNPIFEANVAGLYTFQLEVWDEFGQKSCEPAEVKINVNPIQDIHVELVWETPGDPDEFDEGPNAGTDLDLHFMHPLATGWFDLEYDVFWYNLNPNWGLLNPNFDNDPSLDRDDSDGGGPENLNMNNPEDTEYRIGVHYWRDPGLQSPLGKNYGDVKATVRVFIRGVLRLETKPTTLKRFDFWEVATIDWATQTVNQLQTNDGSAVITPNYVPPIDLDALAGN